MGYDMMQAEVFLYLMVIIFNADMCSSVYVDNRKKVLIPSTGPTQESEDDATLTAEKEYPINFTEQHKKLCLNYNSINGYIFVTEVEIYKFKSKYSKKNKKDWVIRICL